MIEKKIKIGVMGCAAIAKRSVIPAIQQLSNEFDLIGIASRTLDKANEFAKAFSCKAIVGYDELLTQDIDAVYIPLPTGLHDEWITKALEAGKHVYAEKSIANTYESAQKMVFLAQKNKLALMEGFMFQYHTQHQLIKEMVNNGAIGELRGFSSSFGFPPLAKDNFRYNKEIGGGVLFDAAGYPLRAAHFMLGHDFEVKAASLCFDSTLQTELYGSAFLKNKTGIGAHISFGFDNFYQCNYELWGSTGKITAHRAFTPAAEYSPTIQLEKQGEPSQLIQAAPCNHFVEAMRTFHAIITEKATKQSHYEDILLQSKNLALIQELANQ